MRGYWAMADKLYFMIRDLYAVHRKVLEECKLQSEAHQSTMDSPHTWNGSNRTASPSSLHGGSPLIEATSNGVPQSRLPLADMSHSTSDWATRYQWQAENSSGQINRGPSLFKNSESPFISSYDQWMQRQQE
jgi:hypothetical protein